MNAVTKASITRDKSSIYCFLSGLKFTYSVVIMMCKLDTYLDTYYPNIDTSSNTTVNYYIT